MSAESTFFFFGGCGAWGPKNWWFGLGPAIHLLSGDVLGPQWEIPKIIGYCNGSGL